MPTLLKLEKDGRDTIGSVYWKQWTTIPTILNMTRDWGRLLGTLI